MNYFLLLDLLSSIGIVILNRKIHYQDFPDVCYYIKMLRLFTLIRLLS